MTSSSHKAAKSLYNSPPPSTVRSLKNVPTRHRCRVSPSKSQLILLKPHKSARNNNMKTTSTRKRKVVLRRSKLEKLFEQKETVDDAADASRCCSESTSSGPAFGEQFSAGSGLDSFAALSLAADGGGSASGSRLKDKSHQFTGEAFTNTTVKLHPYYYDCICNRFRLHLHTHIFFGLQIFNLSFPNLQYFIIKKKYRIILNTL